MHNNLNVLIPVLIVFLSLPIFSIGQEAELNINNRSGRYMLIKIMEQNQNSADLHSTVQVDAYSETTEYFSETGHYFLKVKATRDYKDPIYTKGDPFKVIVSKRGYSVLTITYDIEETSYGVDPLSGKRISEEEFQKN